ncbi:hypothetical protein K9M78_07840 [Candidatus Bipolaricaulota bacterium]|nr:hypothetical protein [Candidatus Bipolaricaulota bacterium]
MPKLNSTPLILLKGVCLVVFAGFILVLAGFGGTTAALENTEIAISYPTFSGLVDLKFEGINLGLARPSPGGFGIGLALSEDRSLSLKNWKLNPFLTGNFSESEDPSFFDLTGGIEARYFDYRIGSWMLDSTSRLWLDTSGYRVRGNGFYSVGNLTLNYEFQLEPGVYPDGRWFPRERKSQIGELIGRSPTGISVAGGTYLAISGGKNISVGEIELSWTQGITLDYGGYPATLGLSSRLSYRESFLGVLVEDFRIAGCIFNLSWKKLEVGYIETSGRQELHGIYLKYGKSPRIEMEAIKVVDQSGPTVNLRLKW